MGSINIIKGIADSRGTDRENIRADQNATQESIEKMNALGMNELGQYQTGKLAAPQEKILSDYEQNSEATAEQFTDKAGTSESFNESLDDVFIMDSAIMRESMQQKSWEKAMQALGFSWEETKQLIDEHTAERQQSMQIYQGLMGTIGKLISTYTHSGGGS